AEGVYKARQGYFDQLQITTWANERVARGRLMYGHRAWGFEVDLVQNAEVPNEFSGEGYIEVFYGHQVCHYDIRLSIYAFEDGLYVKSLMPETIPSSAPLGSCYAAGPVGTFRHPHPY